MTGKRSILFFALILALAGMVAAEAGSWSYFPGDGTYWGWPKLPTQPNPPAANPEPGNKTGDKGDDPAPTPISGLTEEEELSFRLVNAERQARGLVPLEINMELVRLARLRVNAMVGLSWEVIRTHVIPPYGSPLDMLVSAGINYRFWGENIGIMSTVKKNHEAFMDSPDHRSNIICSAYREMGVAVLNKNGKTYVSQIFLRRRD
ncbi:MAG TPA: hypothetical protein GXX29_13760 [Firmicutes bacterium]|nr:hypothetical protein [Bacillota bacterium]